MFATLRMDTSATQEPPTQTTEHTKICTGKCSSRSKNPKPKPISEFMKDGKELSRCHLCRDRENAQKSRPEIKAKRAQHQQDNKPWQAYRDRKKEELGIDNYRAQNNQSSRQWRDTNKEHVKEYFTSSLPAQLSSMKFSLNKRNINIAVTDFELSLLMQLPCYFCGIYEDRGFQTFARLDHTKPVQACNLVSSCHVCVMMKKALDVHTFVERCHHIAGVQEFPKAWPAVCEKMTYSTFKSSARKRKIEVAISAEEHALITLQHCTYCHRGPANGIDRRDNDLKSYTYENCVSCCRECNVMKCSVSRNEAFDSSNFFINACTRVARHCSVTHFQGLTMPVVTSCTHSVNENVSSDDDSVVQSEHEDKTACQGGSSSTARTIHVNIEEGPISDDFLQAEAMRRIAPDNIYEKGNLSRAREAAKEAQATKRQKTIAEVHTAKERVYASKALPDGTPAPQYVSYSEKNNSVTLERRSKAANISVRITIPGTTWQERVQRACSVVGYLDANDAWSQYNGLTSTSEEVHGLFGMC